MIIISSVQNDLELLEELKNKAAERDLGVKSIYYYYAIKHTLEAIKEMENKIKQLEEENENFEFSAKS